MSAISRVVAGLPFPAAARASRAVSGNDTTLWVDVVRDADGLERAVPAWEQLVQQAIEPNPLYEHWMLLPALRARPRGDFHCLLLWSKARGPGHAPELRGLFPFQRVPRFRGLPITALKSWRHHSWLLGTPLLSACGAHESLQTLLDRVNAGSGASLVQFEYVPADGAFHGVLADVLRRREASAVTVASFTRALLRKRAGEGKRWEATLSGETRKNLRRKERRLSELGTLTRVMLRPGDDVHRWIGDFLRLEASGWKGASRSALACSEYDRRFAAKMLAAAFARGRLELVGLDLDGRALARCCNVISGDTAYAYRCAYDERFAHFSPGLMAELETMRQFHARPEVRLMDSLTDPDNETLNRLWKDRRTMHTVMLGVGAWGELWTSVFPILRWAKRCFLRMKAIAGRRRTSSKAAG